MELFGLPALEIVYILTGIVLTIVAIQSFNDKENTKRVGTGLFWLTYAISFMFGKYIPDEINGWMVSCLSLKELAMPFLCQHC